MLYQLTIGEEVVTVIVTVPGPQWLPLMSDGAVGIVLITATTGTRGLLQVVPDST